MGNLRWKKLTDTFTLMLDNETLVQLHYTNCTHATFQLGSDMYTVVVEGRWRPRYLVTKNNAPVISVSTSLWRNHGTISMRSGEVYEIEYGFKDGVTVRFYDQQQEILIYNECDNQETGQIKFQVGTALVDGEKVVLLATLGLIMFSSMVFDHHASSTQ